jgi:hypothetical protein
MGPAGPEAFKDQWLVRNDLDASLLPDNELASNQRVTVVLNFQLISTVTSPRNSAENCKQKSISGAFITMAGIAIIGAGIFATEGKVKRYQ